MQRSSVSMRQMPRLSRTPKPRLRSSSGPKPSPTKGKPKRRRRKLWQRKARTQRINYPELRRTEPQRLVLFLYKCRGGEMADAPALGAGGGNPMEVQVLSPAPFDSQFVRELLTHGKPRVML